MSEEKPFVNVLLLGNEGVEKSSFINCFANYIKYDTLSHALIKLEYRVPTQIGIFGHLVTVGENNRCKGKDLKVTDYIFNVKHVKLRLIDTPGIVFERKDQHEKVVQAIITQIPKYGHLNAIAFVLRRAETFIQEFKDYIKHLLLYMNKSIFQNVIYIFSQGASPSNDFLDNIKSWCKETGVKIPCPNTNILIFNSVHFSLLAGYFQGVKFVAEHLKFYEASWIQSVNCCKNLIEYVVGDEHIMGLKPHLFKETVEDVFSFLVDLSCSLSENLSILRYYKNFMVDDVNMLPIISLEKALKSGKAVYICQSRKCISLRKIGDCTIEIFESFCCIKASNTEKNCTTCKCAMELHSTTRYLKKMTVQSLNINVQTASHIDELCALLHVLGNVEAYLTQNFGYFWNDQKMRYKKLEEVYLKNKLRQGTITLQVVLDGINLLKDLDWTGAAIKNIFGAIINNISIEGLNITPDDQVMEKSAICKNVKTENPFMYQELKDEIKTLKSIVGQLLEQQKSLKISSLEQFAKKEDLDLLKEQVTATNKKLSDKVEIIQQQRFNKYKAMIKELTVKFDSIQIENEILKLEVLEIKSNKFLPQSLEDSSRTQLENESSLSKTEAQEQSVKIQNLTKKIKTLKRHSQTCFKQHTNFNNQICTLQQFVEDIKKEMDLIKKQVVTTNQELADENNKQNQIILRRINEQTENATQCNDNLLGDIRHLENRIQDLSNKIRDVKELLVTNTEEEQSSSNIQSKPSYDAPKKFQTLSKDIENYKKFMELHKSSADVNIKDEENADFAGTGKPKLEKLRDTLKNWKLSQKQKNENEYEEEFEEQEQ